MRVVSVNAGAPREIEWRGKRVSTAIFKSPVPGRVKVGRLNVAGDRQADLSVHGGPEKAVYAYPAEHYAFWRDEIPGIDLSWGAFGENLTTEGLREDEVRIGDRFRAGGAQLVVTQPRMPCFKLAIRFNRADMVKRFMQSGRTGFYLAVLGEGDIGAGDSLELLSADDGALSVADIVRLYAADAGNQDLLRRASALPSLPESWRQYFRERLWEPDS